MAASGSVRPNETVLHGPFTLYEGSMIMEFLKPDSSRDASVLMKCTWKHDHPLCKLGKGHPFTPPLHLHYLQSETCQVTAGRVGTTHSANGNTPINKTSYLVDTILTPENTRIPHETPPWTPHTFWCVADAEEDSTMLMWAHPIVRLSKQMPTSGMYPPDMDHLFFMNLLRYNSAVYEGKDKLDILGIMLSQYETQTALLIFPTAWWLGPLRWWVPWQLMAACAALARWQGKTALLQKYIPADDWKVFMNEQKKGGKAV